MAAVLMLGCTSPWVRGLPKGEESENECGRLRSEAAAEDGGAEPGGGGSEADDFEARLAKLQRKATSGKKAELRKAKKQGTLEDISSSSSTKAKESGFVPPVSLKELRKAKKQGTLEDISSSSSSTKAKESGFVPPVSLKQPISDGIAVELGFTPYTERLHGRLAALGLAAVLLVELASADCFVKFHDAGTLFVQVYTVVGLAAVFVKYEKERISVWPKL